MKAKLSVVMIDFSNKAHLIRNKNLFFCLFLVIYTISLFYLCNELIIWQDETFTLHTTSNNLSGVIDQSYNFEGQPPVYFILLSLWRKIDPGIFFARVFSLLFIGLAAYYFHRIVRIISGADYSLWVIIIFLLNPFTIWAAHTIRLYAFLIFLSTISAYFFFSYYREKKNKYLYFFLITCIIGLYTQYLFSFLIAGLMFSVLVFQGWKPFFRLCLYMIPVGLLFIPNLIFIPDQVKLVQSFGSEQSLIEKSFAILSSPDNFIYGFDEIPNDKGIRWSIRLIFILAAAYMYFKLSKKNKTLNDPYFERIHIGLLTIFVFIILLITLVILTHINYESRYMVLLFPLFMLLFTLVKVNSPLTRKVIYGSVSMFFFILAIIDYRHPAMTFDYRSVANYVNRIEKYQEPILIYDNSFSLPFNLYYKGNNPIVPLPHSISFDKNFIVNIKDTFELKQAIGGIKAPEKSYLLISNYTPTDNILMKNRKMIDDYLSVHFTTALDTLFFAKNKDRYLRIRRLEN